jgi:flagellar basal-body rod protein FlgG
MGNFIDIASSVLSQATQRVELSAQNIANITTPGFKRHLSFASLVTASGRDGASPSSLDFSPGKIVNTGNPLDLAIMGKGFFTVASSNGVFYTRAGQFQRDGDGRLVNAQGFALQADDGGDLTIKTDKAFQILADGTVVEDGQPTAKIAVVSLNDPQSARYVDGGVLSVGTSGTSSLETPVIRQGAYEASNVSDGDEMVSIMAALRQAEAGQKLVNVYDDMMGRVLETFGQGSAS